MKNPTTLPLTFALAVSLLVAAAPASAHEGHHHTAMGTIEVVEAARLDLETKDGEVATFVLTEKTAFERAGEAATRADVEVGERAVVRYETENGRNLAIEVKLGAKKAEPQAAARLGRTLPNDRR